MKKIYTLLALFGVLTLFGQNKVAEKIMELSAEGKSFKSIAPFTTVAPQDKKQNVVREAAFAKIDDTVLQEIVTGSPETFTLSVPYNNQNLEVQLYKVDIFAPGFHVDTDQQENIAFTKGVHYRGIITGDRESVAAFNFFESELNGIISSDELGNVVVAKQLNEDSANYIIYQEANMVIPNTFACHTQEHEGLAPQRRSPHDTQSTRCVTMYFEIDYDLFDENNNSTQQTGVWMTSVYNNVQTLFNNDGISTALKSFFIWTTPDPYEGDSSGDYLSQFGTMRPVFDGDLGQLVGIDPGGLGGVAVTIEGICSDYNFSYSDVFFQYANVPTFSWTVQVITHELGHLMGSPHTHGCYWNGNNTAIDGCGSSQGYVEGNCAQGPIPSASVKGTIMSYCHLVNNVGINFNNGFGLQPSQRILGHVESSACLSTDCINTCINTVRDFAVNATTTSATITWETTNNYQGPWQVAHTSVTGSFTNWQTVTGNSHFIQGLTANTYYKFGVRPLCTSGQTPEVRNFIFATNSANVCGGLQFTDTGGAGGNYGNNQYLLRTFTPNTAGTRIQAVFQSFSTEVLYDYFYVYNGSTASPDNLIDTYTGLTNPGTIQSTAPDGSLTFKFLSDVATTSSGWRATISCINALSTDDTEFSGFSYYPNPSSGIVNIKSAEAFTSIAVYNVAGQLLKQQSVDSTEAAVDISSFANGVYFFRVSNESKQSNFRIIKQ